eukprot:1158610-Pelagomonas_calceolata.AAC.14
MQKVPQSTQLQNLAVRGGPAFGIASTSSGSKFVSKVYKLAKLSQRKRKSYASGSHLSQTLDIHDFGN